MTSEVMEAAKVKLARKILQRFVIFKIMFYKSVATEAMKAIFNISTF